MLHLRLINLSLSLNLLLFKSLITFPQCALQPKRRSYIMQHLRSAVWLIFCSRKQERPSKDAREQKQLSSSYLKGDGVPVNTHHVQLCLFKFYERTSLQCLWFGAECVSAVGVVYWHTELKYTSFFKAREPENIQITQSNSDKLVCLHRAVMFVCRYVNLAGSPLATNSWVRREDTDWRREAKICHSDTNHGDLKRSGMLAELRDSERSIVADWPRGTRAVQWHPSISWSRSLGTTNCLGTPVFYRSASISVSVSTFHSDRVWLLSHIQYALNG